MKFLEFEKYISIPAIESITTTEEYFRQAGVEHWIHGHPILPELCGLEIPATDPVDLAIYLVKSGPGFPLPLHSFIIEELGKKAEVGISQFRELIVPDFCEEVLGYTPRITTHVRGKSGKLVSVEVQSFGRRTAGTCFLEGHPRSPNGPWYDPNFCRTVVVALG